jgi:hypothetical protein
MISVTYPAGKAGLIQVVDGLLDEKLCRNFLVRMNQLWSFSFAGKTLSGVDAKTKLTEDLYYNENVLNENWLDTDMVLDQQICQAITSAVAIYKQEYRHLDDWGDINDSGFQVQKYAKSCGYYRPHVDSFPMPFSSVCDRVLAMVIYLNDVDYGGETNFPLHEVAVIPKAGRIVFFPATWTHPHESRVPISGDKWIISSFINNGEIVANDSRQLVESIDHEHNGCEDHTHDEHYESPPLILGTVQDLISDFVWGQHD